MATLLRKAGTKTVERRGRAEPTREEPRALPPAPFALELGLNTAEDMAATVRGVADYLSRLDAPFAQAELKGPDGGHAGYFALGSVGKLRGKPVRYLAGLTCQLQSMPRRDLLDVLADMADKIEQVQPKATGASVQRVLPGGRGMFWFTLEQ